MKKSVGVILLALFFTACATGTPPSITIAPSTTRSAAHGLPFATLAGEDPDLGPIPIPVLKATDGPYGAMLEPGQGAYIGAWLGPHTPKRDFILQAEKNHALFVYQYTLGDPLPITWILQCIAIMATPIFMVAPPADLDAPLRHDLGYDLEYLARGLGAFNLPMFVAFDPLVFDLGAADFAVMFRYARSIFMGAAPMAAFVWVAPATSATLHNPFFPGEDVVDWVGVGLFGARDGDGLRCVLTQLEGFYHRFRSHHPLMILPLGISHFSRQDHSYHLYDAQAEITRVYEGLQSFPRVGAIVYGDGLGLREGFNDDFAIGIEPLLMDAYRQAIQGPHFLNIIGRSNLAEESLWRSAHGGFFWEDEFFIRVDTLEEFGLPVPRGQVEMDGIDVVEAGRVDGVVFCPDRSVLIISGD